MTKKQFRDLRRSVGLSQTKLAQKMGVTLRTVTRWETGTFPVPKIAGLALKTVVMEAKKKGV